MEAHDAADVLAKVIAPVAAGRAMAACHRTVHDDIITGSETRSVLADSCDLSRRFGTDHKRQLALRKGHSAISPEVEVIERDGFNANLDLAIAGRRRRWDVGKFKLAVGDQPQGTHGGLARAAVRPAQGPSPAKRSGRQSRTSSKWRGAASRHAPCWAR